MVCGRGMEWFKVNSKVGRVVRLGYLRIGDVIVVEGYMVFGGFWDL